MRALGQHATLVNTTHALPTPCTLCTLCTLSSKPL